MDFRDWTFLVAASGNLALALLSVSRAGKSPMGLPLALLAFDFFGWTFATFCHHRFGGPFWRPLDVLFTSLAPVFVLDVVLTFVGKRRAHVLILRASYAAFGALALSSMPAFLTAWGNAWIESRTWAVVFLVGWLPTLAFGLWLLIAHLRSGADADEQVRTRIVLAALFLGGAFASTDPLADMGVDMPGLTPVGAIVSTSLLAVVALRFRLFDRNLRGTTTLYATSIAIAAVFVYLTLFQGLRGNLPAVTFGVTVVTFVLAAVVREATSSLSTHHERLERLAVLGRFSAQMAHDLRNPLAAMVGAVQVLDGESAPHDREGRAFREMIVEQAARIVAIVERYDRLGRVEPVRSLVRVNALAKRVATLSSYSVQPTGATGVTGVTGVTLALDLDPSLDGPRAELELDPDLVSGALENVVRNALEAMQNGGTLTVRTRREARGGGGFTLVIAVQDTGEGMDVRHVERAFDDFYTTKATGTGLGLPFVRRVALAHGGDVALRSRRGIGTTIELRLPA